MAELETEVKVLKSELKSQRKIYDRLDIAIEKLTDVSNSINQLLAVHEEKLSTQEETIDELDTKIDKLHSKLSTNDNRIGLLEKWRHLVIGGSIVVGFILHKFIDFSP
jgi:chromosome segregation ATPase